MDTIKGTITRRMDYSMNALKDEFKDMLSERDFKRSLEALRNASKSERPTRLRNLFILFDRCGIEYERGRENEYYEKLVKTSEKIPSEGQIEETMLLALYDIYESYPAPEEYMKRIVDRLCSKSDGWEKEPLRLRILKQFIKYGNYLADAGFGGKTAIQGYVKKKTGKKPKESDVLSELDDGIFEFLESASKSQKKPDGKYGLIKTADDLASGKFRMGGATKKSLYLFAMVFDMTYYTGSDVERFDPSTDVEYNLFKKYYTNNLMRFITEAYQKNLSEYEIDPSGQGINYKNFAEMVYLYYISRPLEPAEKIKASSEMIEEIIRRSTENKSCTTTEHEHTASYMNIFSEDILNLPENDFIVFICRNYDCRTHFKNHDIGPLQINTSQKTAFEEYKKIISELKHELSEKNIPFSDCNYGLWFSDAASFRKKGSITILEKHDGTDREKCLKLMELLLAINDFVGYSPERSRPKALQISSAHEVTRTSLFVAYYYLYNLKHENDKKMIGKSFEEVFNDFRAELNDILEKSYYNPVSSRNIFDIVLIFSSYAFLNI